jgi:hypothetical protein
VTSKPWAIGVFVCLVAGSALAQYYGGESPSRPSAPSTSPGVSGGSGDIYRVLRPGNTPRETFLKAKFGSLAASRTIAGCSEGRLLAEIKECLVRGLEQFAATLEPLAPTLPEPLRDLPARLRSASRDVIAARTKEEARGAVRRVIGDIRKAIDFIRADDPATVSFSRRTGLLAANILDAVDAKIEKCAGI